MAKEKNDYPPERKDWLMTVYYADIKSRFHCILCEKTHFIKDCPNKLTRIEPEVKKKKYDYEDDQYINPHNYGW